MSIHVRKKTINLDDNILYYTTLIHDYVVLASKIIIWNQWGNTAFELSSTLYVSIIQTNNRPGWRHEDIYQSSPFSIKCLLSLAYGKNQLILFKKVLEY